MRESTRESIKFVKLHGGGNDYVLIDARHRQHEWASLAQAICDRHYGVGADGFLMILPSQVADLRMRMFNPDGSEAEMCCNGTRCFAKWVLDNEVVAPEGPLLVETIAGIIAVEPYYEDGLVVGASETVVTPEFDPPKIPVILDKNLGQGSDVTVELEGMSLELNCVSIGNPHAVTFVDQPVEQFPLSLVGPQIETMSIFPNRVNFEVVNIIDSSTVNARVWERGVGETLSCGTGACAVASVGRLKRGLDEKVDVILPGGTLAIEWNGTGKVLLSGPVAQVYEGSWPI